MILYGIKNCDSVKTARRWLEANGLDYQFHDFRSDGLDRSTLDYWLTSIPWQLLINKRGTTWRKLEDPRKQQLEQSIAIDLMLSHPTLIKRPVLCHDSFCIVGFKESDYAAHFSNVL